MSDRGDRPVRYLSRDEDSWRWLGFEFRSDDIVISSRSKSGTTWMQHICALLVFQTAGLPAPVAELSPWLDHLIAPKERVYAQLAAQTHRRFIKTHTPIDGVPIDPRVTYAVVARHPLDAAVSLYHQGDNLDRALMRRMSGQPEPATPEPPRPPLHEWLVAWIERDTTALDDLDSLPGFMWHLSDAWARRDADNVVLVHYDDLLGDLDGQMRMIAARLGIDVPDTRWPDLVAAATFDAMRARADALLPTSGGVHKSSTAFFRRGTSGAGAEELTGVELAAYYTRARELAPADLFGWLHRA